MDTAKNIETEEILKRRNEEILHHQKVLLELAKMHHTDLAKALSTITEMDAKTLQVERVSVWLFNEERTEIICEDLFILSRGEHDKGVKLQSRQYPLYFQSLEESRTIAAHDALTDPRTSEFGPDYLHPLGISSMMDTPVRLRGKVVGIVCHEQVGAKREWTPEEQEFAAAVADMVSLALESHERHETETQLQNSLSLLQATLESTADGILVVDADGKMVSFNQKFVDMWNLPETIVKSKDDNAALSYVLSQLINPEGFIQKVRELYQQPEAESYDVLEFIDGRIFERFSQPQRVGDTSVGRVWSFRDITERKRAEDDSRKANEELRRLSDMKSEFASMVSHELRTPLTVVKEAIGLILDGIDGPVTSAQRDTLGLARDNVDRLARLINSVLDYEKLESGKLEMLFEKTNLNELVREVHQFMELVARKKKVQLHVEIPARPLDMVCDPDKLKEVLLNLIDNSLKFTPSGGEISVKLKQVQDHVEILVEDNGVGIKKEELHHIFDMFSQAGGPGRIRRVGSGVGLAVCRLIVSQHRGHIAVESTPGKGSKFKISLPKTSPVSNGLALI